MVDLIMVKNRLEQLGYPMQPEDEAALEFCLTWVTNYAYEFCNVAQLPQSLDNRTIDRVCAKFLFQLKNAGKLKDFDYQPCIRSLKQGDTTITYATGHGEDTPENRFDSLVKSLEKGYDKWLTRYRRLRW